MRSLLLTVSLVSSLSFAGQSTEVREVGDFNELEVSGGLELVVTKGKPSITLEGDEAELKKLTTTVEKGRLVIERKGFSLSFGHVIARVTAPTLSKLVTSGGVTATVTDVAAKDFTVDASGGGSVKAQLDVETLVFDGSGGVTTRLSGKATKLVADLSGGVSFDGRALSTKAVVLDASGGCAAKVMVSGGITGSASGGTTVSVFGNPTAAQLETSGASHVEYVK
ncbi:MAG: head GIN domain-containing protein [Myxococcaceae bacterium]